MCGDLIKDTYSSEEVMDLVIELMEAVLPDQSEEVVLPDEMIKVEKQKEVGPVVYFHPHPTSVTYPLPLSGFAEPLP